MRRAILALLLSVSLWGQAQFATQAQAGAFSSITSVTIQQGTLVKIIVGTSVAAGTIKVWDLSAAKCTGTPSNPILTLTIPAAVANPFEIDPNLRIENGICVLTSSASFNITVHYN